MHHLGSGIPHYDLQPGLMAYVPCRHNRQVTQLQMPMDNESDLEEDFSEEDEDYLKEYVCDIGNRLRPVRRVPKTLVAMRLLTRCAAYA